MPVKSIVLSHSSTVECEHSDLGWFLQNASETLELISKNHIPFNLNLAPNTMFCCLKKRRWLRIYPGRLLTCPPVIARFAHLAHSLDTCYILRIYGFTKRPIRPSYYPLPPIPTHRNQIGTFCTSALHLIFLRCEFKSSKYSSLTLPPTTRT